MLTNQSKKILLGFAALVLAVAACNLPGQNSGSTSTPTITAIVPITGATDTPAVAATSTSTLAPTDTVAPTATDTLSPTATSNAVIVTAASNGSLGILRGPSIYYDVFGYLQNGQSSQALARNSDGSWLYMAVPNYPTVFGWAYVGSQYSTVTGDINSLPFQSVSPAVPAYIRNCTFHPMLIQPGGVVLQPQTDKVNRVKQFPPGSYKAYDQSAGGSPLVLVVTLKEGISVDIQTDGLKNTYKCP